MKRWEHFKDEHRKKNIENKGVLGQEGSEQASVSMQFYINMYASV